MLAYLHIEPHNRCMLFDTWENFLNSDFFVGLVTLLVGLVAFRIYRKQKIDQKKDAANVILLELETAEQKLQRINSARADDLNRLPNIYLMEESSWDKFRYLFVKDFDRNEWDKITDFYSKCKSYDEAVSYNESHFDKHVQEMRKIQHKYFGAYSAEYVENTFSENNPRTIQENKDTMDAKKSMLLDAIGIRDTSNTYLYSPQQPLDQATIALLSIESNISLTSVGQKLKSISFKKTLWQKFLLKLSRQ